MGLEHPNIQDGTLIWDTFNAWLVKYDKNSSSPTRRNFPSMLSRFKRSLSSKGSLRTSIKILEQSFRIMCRCDLFQGENVSCFSGRHHVTEKNQRNDHGSEQQHDEHILMELHFGAGQDHDRRI